MEKTYLKPSVEIISTEAGAFMDTWRISINNDEYEGEVGAKRRTTQGFDNPQNNNAPDSIHLVAPSFPKSIWDD